MDLPSLDLTTIAALIGGLSGVLSALITAKISSAAARRQADRDAAKRSDDDAKNAAYLTAQIAPVLRAYAAACELVSMDEGEIDQTPGKYTGITEVTVNAPTFVVSGIEVEWKSLPHDLMADVLTFYEKDDAVTQRLQSRAYSDPPEYPDFFNDRMRFYAQLGLDALRLADRLHEHAKLTANSDAGYLRERLSHRLAELTKDARADAPPVVSTRDLLIDVAVRANSVLGKVIQHL